MKKFLPWLPSTLTGAGSGLDGQLLGVFPVRCTFCTDDGPARLRWIIFTKKPTTCLVGVMARWQTGPKYICGLVWDQGAFGASGTSHHKAEQRDEGGDGSREVDESDRRCTSCHGPVDYDAPINGYASPMPRVGSFR